MAPTRVDHQINRTAGRPRGAIFRVNKQHIKADRMTPASPVARLCSVCLCPWGFGFAFGRSCVRNPARRLRRKAFALCAHGLIAMPNRERAGEREEEKNSA